MKINELPKEGKVCLPVLISKADIGRTNKNTPYLSLLLEDKTGTLDAKFWNLTEEEVKEWKTGMIVEASGEMIIHRNAVQLRVRTLKQLEDAQVMDYIRSAPMSKDEMKTEVDLFIREMKNEVIQTIVGQLIQDREERFYSWPAAVKNHHNFPGGLAYHSLTMAKLSQAIAPFYPFLDQDLVIAGIFLHDLGKVEELSSSFLPDYTPKGNLLGHITIAVNWIDEVACRYGWQDKEEVMLLKHMVLSHHGKLEYGSPVLPMIPEAEVLTLLDNLDSRLYMMNETLSQTLPGSVSPRVFALENRMLYHRVGQETTLEMECE